MTDELAEARRHITWLRDQIVRKLNYGDDAGPLETCDVCETCGFEPGKPVKHMDHCQIPAADAFLSRLDTQGQRVEGGAAMPSSRAELHDIIRREQDSIHALRRELGDKDVEIISLSAELTRLKAAQVEHERTVRLAITDEMVLRGAWAPINEFARSLGREPFDPRMTPDANEIERAKLILSAAFNIAPNGTPKEKAGS